MYSDRDVGAWAIVGDFSARSARVASITRYAPAPYLNQPAIPIDDKDELVETVARTFADSHRQQLALELAERDPHALHTLQDLTRAQERARDDEQRLQALLDQREQTSWWKRSERREIERSIETHQRGRVVADHRLDRLRDNIARRMADPATPQLALPAREPLADLDLARDPHDLGPDLGL